VRFSRTSNAKYPFEHECEKNTDSAYVCRVETDRTGFEIFKKKGTTMKPQNTAEAILVEQPRK